jgi:carnitine-CoA ligase
MTPELETSESTTFQAQWQNAVRERPNATFLVFLDDDDTQHRWTYAEFDLLVSRTAGKLSTLGVRRGDAVHCALRNSPAFVLVWLASAQLGAWMVSSDPASSRTDLASQFSRTQPQVGVCATDRAAAYREASQGFRHTLIEVDEDFRDTTDGSPLLGRTAPSTPVAAHERLALMFTSGTTSTPKGVVLTQANYGHMGESMASLADLGEGHRWFVSLPLFHGNAQFYCFAPAINRGASVALASKFSASRWVQQARLVGATHTSLFAAPIRMILARSTTDAGRLELAHAWFAQDLAPEHYHEFARLIGCLPRQLYGMTETVSVATADMRARPSSDVIGTPTRGREVELRDPASGQRVREGDPGVLCIRGTPGVDLFKEYLDDPERTAQALRADSRGTWLYTGDLVRADSEGNLRFVGRVDDVIKVGGENVSLTEVEAHLAGAPGVLEVAVVAKEDAVLDKVPVAFVVPDHRTRPPTLEELGTWSSENLVPSARPRQWAIVETLPRTSVGKIRRFALSAHDTDPLPKK